MKKSFVLVSFIKLSISDKISFYRNVITKMTDNAYFPTPDVSLTDATAAVDKFEADDIASKDGSRTATAVRNDSEEKTNTLFYKLADYVNRIADGDEAIILSSGFELSAQPAPRHKAPLTVNDGSHTGSVKLVAKAVERAASYSWQMAKDTLPVTADGWIIIGQTSAASFEKDGFVPGGKYFFRVAAITPTGIMDYTDPVAKIVV